MGDAKRDVRVYLSHSYRPKDRRINLAVLRRLYRGVFFEVDPPGRRTTANGKPRPMDVTFLERMMRRSGGFLAIVPDRSSETEYESWSPYQCFEYGLAVRSGKPRLIIAEQEIHEGPLIPEDRERLLNFDRESGAITGASDEEIEERIHEFVARARAYVPIHRSRVRPLPAFLRCDPPDERYDRVRNEVRRLAKQKSKEFKLVDLEVPLVAPAEDFRLIGAAEEAGVVIADLRSAFSPPHVLGYLQGRGIPWVRTCWVGPEEDEAQLRSSLALADGQPADGPTEPSALLAGYQIDQHMQPVLFWHDGEEQELAQKIVRLIFEHRDRQKVLEKVRDVQKYLLSLSGNKVFVSNASSQNALAIALAKELKEQAYPCFQYEEQSRSPGELLAELRREIATSDLFLALVDADYWQSEFCRFEIGLAVEGWARHDMRFLIYTDDPERIPKFLASDLLFGLSGDTSELTDVVKNVGRIFDEQAGRELTDAEWLTRLLAEHFPGDPLQALTENAGLKDEEADQLRSELESDAPTYEQLIPSLISQTSVDSRRSYVLASFLSTALLRVGAQDRSPLRKVIIRHRLCPGVFSFRRWERFLERNEALWCPHTASTLLKTAAELAGEGESWLPAVDKVGRWLGKELGLDDAIRARLDAPDGRLCIEGPLEDLGVPYEWMQLPHAAEPLGRWRPVRRRITGLGHTAPPASLDRALAYGEAPPPRALVFGYGTPGIANVDAELEEINRLFRIRYEELGWPTALVSWVPSAKATPSELRRLLQTGDYQLLHLSGHAGYDADRPFLQLHPEAGQENVSGRVFGEDLRSWTAGGDLRFAFLNVCLGALGNADSKPVLGQLQTICGELLEAGVPEVLSHLWPVADDQGRQLAHDFYSELLSDKHEFDAAQALQVARHRRKRTQERVWASPVLVNQGAVHDRRLPLLSE